MKIDDNSEDTIMRIKKLREEPNLPGETHVQKFNRIMSEPRKRLSLLKIVPKTESFADEINRLQKEESPEWVRNLYKKLEK